MTLKSFSGLYRLHLHARVLNDTLDIVHILLQQVWVIVLNQRVQHGVIAVGLVGFKGAKDSDKLVILAVGQVLSKGHECGWGEDLVRFLEEWLVENL